MKDFLTAAGSRPPKGVDGSVFQKFLKSYAVGSVECGIANDGPDALEWRASGNEIRPRDFKGQACVFTTGRRADELPRTYCLRKRKNSVPPALGTIAVFNTPSELTPGCGTRSAKFGGESVVDCCTTTELTEAGDQELLVFTVGHMIHWLQPAASCWQLKLWPISWAVISRSPSELPVQSDRAWYLEAVQRPLT